MKLFKTLFIVAGLTLSSLAMAEDGGSRTFAHMEAASQNTLNQYQVVQKQDTKSLTVVNKSTMTAPAGC